MMLRETTLPVVVAALMSPYPVLVMVAAAQYREVMYSDWGPATTTPSCLLLSQLGTLQL